MITVAINKKYKLGHSIKHRYGKIEDLFCPKCGKKDLWQSMDSGDYYIGSESICVNCSSISYMENTALNSSDEYEIKHIKELKALVYGSEDSIE